LPLEIELVVGVPRSGTLVANILAVHRNLPFADLEGFLAGRVLSVGATKRICQEWDSFLEVPRHVLVVDDSSLTGNEMRRAKQAVVAARVHHHVRFATVYVNPGREREVDFYRTVLPAPRIFEWNLMQSVVAAQGCWDIDGILCRDPSPKENDDGPGYLRFIREVPLQLRPSLPLNWLVTSRLEKYRAATEDWLAKNAIQYNHLVMLDLPSRKARVETGCHGSFKASVYKSTDTRIFIESSYRQAIEIARLSGKYAIAFETQECISPGWKEEMVHGVKDVKKVLTKRIRETLRRVRDACTQNEGCSGGTHGSR
jgi:uncharacterized HAD superfamily protein